ncbi:MAG: hypothetical protein M3552_09675 [Planctomycetota bacterium]|nr:hypothetical protein [Planctomycetota bacterium]
MFGFFRRRPTCPIPPIPKDWVETRLEWLIEQFGADVFLSRPLVLPNRDILPEKFDDSDEAVRSLLDRICDLMGVESSEIDLRIVKPQGHDLHLVDGGGRASPTGFGGLYQGGPIASKRGRRGGRVSSRSTISLNADELINLIGLIGTMAHELAHHRLLGEGRIRPDAFDHELATDLTAIFHGFGLFLADGTRNWAASYDVWPGTNLKRPEYMTPPMCGYALAHRAWLCNELKPAWASQLSYDVRAAFKQGLRFLRETKDSRLAGLGVSGDA